MDEVLSDSSAKRARWFWAIAFVAAMGAAGGIINTVKLGFIGSLAVAFVPMLLLFPMTRSAERAQAASGCATPATQRYTRRFVAMSFGYVLALFVALGIDHSYTVDGPLLWVVALVPTIPIMGMIWTIARLLVEETDEFQRMRMVRASLVATGVLLVVGTLWGFLEMFGLVPHLWMWAVFPIWSVGLGLGQLYNRMTIGVGGC